MRRLRSPARTGVVMNFCKLIDGEYRCTAKNQRHCRHSVMEVWEVFCQWCNHPSICGIGRQIHEGNDVFGQARKSGDHFPEFRPGR